jgi:ABC-type iron transport system FetAB ATPase subunit
MRNAAPRRPVVALRYDGARHDSGKLPPAAEQAVLAARRGVARLTLACQVQLDEATAYASRVFDRTFDGITTVLLSPAPAVPPPERWAIGALLGPSGCGKSTHMRGIARRWTVAVPPGQRRAVCVTPQPADWPLDLSVLSHLCAALGPLPAGVDTRERRQQRDAVARSRVHAVAQQLDAVGLSRGAWLLPFDRLSSGERELAAVAYALTAGEAFGAGDAQTAQLTLVVADEFTSALDDRAAHAFAARLAAYVRARPHLRLLVAGVREQELRGALRPDWAYGVLAGHLELFSDAATAPASPPPPAASPPPAAGDAAAVAALFTPPTVRLVVRALPPGIKSKDRHLEASGAAALWSRLFEPHHYLDSDIGRNPTCYVCRLDDDSGGVGGEPVGFVAVATAPGVLPDDDPRPRLRESRLVVEPRFQGLGIGPRLSRLVALHACLHGNGSKDGPAGGGAGGSGAGRASGGGAAPSGQAPIRYLVVTALESLAAARDRDLNNWARQTPYTKYSKARAAPR